MIVSKVKPEQFQKPELKEDSWEVIHAEDGSMNEYFRGKVNIEEENSLMYLGFMLSKNGDTMKNIIHKQNKTIDTKKQVLKLIEPLGPYTFEGTFIYLHSLLRSTLLYAVEAMNNVKEAEYRSLEAIEESLLTQVFQTKRSCPKHLLYLESGIVPARYQVQKQVLVFLQHILQQPRNSIMYKMFEALLQNPTKGDWAENALELIKKFKLNLTLNEIQGMSPSLFKRLVKRKMEEVAFKELQKKQQGGKKGKLIEYKFLAMADYLLPEVQLSTENICQLFSLRTEMNENPINYGEKIPHTGNTRPSRTCVIQEYRFYTMSLSLCNESLFIP